MSYVHLTTSERVKNRNVSRAKFSCAKDRRTSRASTLYDFTRTKTPPHYDAFYAN